MKSFPNPQLAVLRTLRTVWDAQQFIVIGAAALAWHLGLWWRGTLDLDLSVSAGPDGYAGDLERLGWHRDRDALQRWVVPGGSFVDVVPADSTLLSAGILKWPDGSEMNLVGLRGAFADAVPAEVAPAVTVRVASLRSIVVLKMTAYLDRPWDRENDLADIAHILSGFVPLDSDQRWTDEVLNFGLDFDDVSPFMLGKQLAGLVDGAQRKLVQAFLGAIEDPDDRLRTLLRMARRAPVSWKDPKGLLRAWGAFRRGFESRS